MLTGAQPPAAELDSLRPFKGGVLKPVSIQLKAPHRGNAGVSVGKLAKHFEFSDETVVLVK